MTIETTLTPTDDTVIAVAGFANDISNCLVLVKETDLEESDVDAGRFIVANTPASAHDALRAAGGSNLCFYEIVEWGEEVPDDVRLNSLDCPIVYGFEPNLTKAVIAERRFDF